MEHKVTEFQSTVDDIHTTGEFILKRLNQVHLSDGGHVDCPCDHRTETLETEISALQSQCRKLDDKINSRNNSQLSDAAKSLQERLDWIENMIPKGTDESKTGTDVVGSGINDVGHKTKSVDCGAQTDPVLPDATVKTITDAEANTKHFQDLPVEVGKHGETDKAINSETKPVVTQTKEGTPTEVSESQTNNRSDCQTGRECGSKQTHTSEHTSEESDISKEKALPRKEGNITKGKDLSVEKDTSEGNNMQYKSDRKSKQSSKRHGAIGKPNFMTSKQPTVKMVKQVVWSVYDGEAHWRTVAQNELDRGRTVFQFLEGVHSVICLDISESMARSNAWTEARTFLTDYLTGLENMAMSHSTNMKTEYVALVTFGHETKVDTGYTDHYEDVRKRLDNIKLGGPTQMYGGILMALAAAWCSGHRIERLGNGSNVFTKIIMVSDGRPTESDLIAGPDIPDNSKVDETKAKILQEMEGFRKDHQDLFFVPVGDSDLDFHNTMAVCSGGMLLDYRQGKRLARRHYLTAQLVDPIGLVLGISTHGSGSDLSSEDKEDLRNIQERAKLHVDEIATSVSETDMYGESKSKQLPSIGSRVRRGPDWHYGTHDKNGPGTVIGHADNDQQIWVEWDTEEHQNLYSYGTGGYDVLLVDEPRRLKSGEKIAVGCEVRPGKNWKRSEGNMSLGIVIKLDKGSKKATVRWNNGKRGDYSYGESGLQEIELKTGSDNSGDIRVSNVSSSASSSDWESQPAMTIEEFAARQTKNKNKHSQ